MNCSSSLAPTESLIRSKLAESEAVDIKHGVVDAASLGPLLSQGFEGRRIEVLRTAVPDQLSAHAKPINPISVRNSHILGVHHIGANEPSNLNSAKLTSRARINGAATVAPDGIREQALADKGSPYVSSLPCPSGIRGRAGGLAQMNVLLIHIAMSFSPRNESASGLRRSAAVSLCSAA